MWIPDEQWPWPHHPVTVADDGQLVVHDDVAVPAFQVRALTVERAAAWCGGTVIMVNGGPAVLIGAGVAGLGDYVMHRDDFRPEPAAEFTSRWHPASA